jgi:hypothetical protein
LKIREVWDLTKRWEAIKYSDRMKIDRKFDLGNCYRTEAINYSPLINRRIAHFQDLYLVNKQEYKFCGKEDKLSKVDR